MKRVLLAALPVASSATAAERVRVWEGEVTLETYPLGPDDVNPHFWAIEGSVISPYTMQDNLTTEKVDRTYRAWFLEPHRRLQVSEDQWTPYPLGQAGYLQAENSNAPRPRILLTFSRQGRATAVRSVSSVLRDREGGSHESP